MTKGSPTSPVTTQRKKVKICKVCELPFIQKDESSSWDWYRCSNLLCPLSYGWYDDNKMRIWREVKYD